MLRLLDCPSICKDMKRLNQNITSRYVEAANRLNSRQSRRRIVAYVESYDDVFFWRAVLSRFEDSTRYFEVMLPSRSDRLERGKKAALMRLLDGSVGQDMIACVDADYDYLLQGASPSSRAVLSNRYVFHTFAYAIENMQCYAPSLHGVCVAVTLNDRLAFDFVGFLTSYSQIIYPLFVWNIWHYRTGHYGGFSITDFLGVIELGKLSAQNAWQLLQRLQAKVERMVNSLRRRHPGVEAQLVALRSELATLGVSPDNTYMYVQGHHLFNNVVAPLVKSVCARLARERENEISRQSVHATQCRNELSCYTSSVTDIEATMKKNVGFLASPQYGQIVDCIAAVLNTDKKPGNEV